MFRLVVNDPQVRMLVVALAKIEAPPDCPCMGTKRGVGEDEAPVGGFVFTGYLGASIQVHMGGLGGRWCTRDLLVMVFDYAFNQLGVHKVIAPVPSYNTHALQMDRRGGFVEEARILGAVPDGDLVILTMTRDQCRWLCYPLRGFTRGVTPGQE